MSRKILIVGGVAGGASAAARLRRLDEQARIIMFERDEYISFANCGLPYYIGGVIGDRNKLLVQTPRHFKARFNVDVRVRNEVIGIHREKKQVEVRDRNSDQTYFESYDQVILSPGAQPVRPAIPGIENGRIFTLRNISDTDTIEHFITGASPGNAVVVGGGYIGLEMAENLHRRGLKVTIVEMLEQLMPVLDKEMSHLVHGEIKRNGIELRLNDAVSGFGTQGDKLVVTLKSNAELT